MPIPIDEFPSRRMSVEGRVILTAVVVLSFANGLYARVMLSLVGGDFSAALLGTFGINLIAWGAMIVVYDLLEKISFLRISKSDSFVLTLTTVLAALPVSGLSWIGLTILGFYFIIAHKNNAQVRRAMILLISLCFCMFWSPLIFRFFTDYILRIDTMLVAFVSGTSSDQNLIEAADGKTVLQVLEGCSSFTNLSLAFLGFMIARSYYGTRGFLRSILFISISCCAVILINTSRIGVIALRPDLYDVAHGPYGANIAGLLTTLSIVLIAHYGAKR